MAFAYALERKTFGKKLIENQVIRRKLAEVAHRIEAHWAWLEQIAFQVNSSSAGWQTPNIASQIALAKIQGGQMLELACREAQQVFGGAGYQKGGRGATVEQISRDLRMFVSLLASLSQKSIRSAEQLTADRLLAGAARRFLQILPLDRR
jgi:alkylation response protein AidB-like acyl-CoA dehydrogenase